MLNPLLMKITDEKSGGKDTLEVAQVDELLIKV